MNCLQATRLLSEAMDRPHLAGAGPFESTSRHVPGVPPV